MKKRSKKAEKLSDATPKVESFETFFARCVHRGKLQFWQHDEVAAFFRDCRLKEKEDPETYETTLKRY